MVLSRFLPAILPNYRNRTLRKAGSICSMVAHYDHKRGEKSKFFLGDIARHFGRNVEQDKTRVADSGFTPPLGYQASPAGTSSLLRILLSPAPLRFGLSSPWSGQRRLLSGDRVCPACRTNKKPASGMRVFVWRIRPIDANLRARPPTGRRMFPRMC